MLHTTHIAKLLRLAHTLTLVVILSGCDLMDSAAPDKSSSPGPPVSVISVDPSFGYAGTLFSVAFHPNRDSFQVDYRYELNGYELASEISTNDSLMIRLPHILRFTGLFARVWDFRSDSIYRIPIEFRPIPELCDEQVCVKWFDTDTVSSRLVQRYIRGGYWNATKAGDTITLGFQYFDGYDFQSSTKFLDLGPDALPRFLAHTQRYVRYGDSSYLTLIKIDSWNTSGNISGALFSSNNPVGRKHYEQAYFSLTVN